MRTLLRASVLFSALFLSGFVGADYAHAQATPGATNRILEAVRTPDDAKKYYDDCYWRDGVMNVSFTSCDRVLEPVHTTCNIVAAGYACTFEHTADKSTLTADPNLFGTASSTYTNRDSAGNVVGQSTGTTTGATGTLNNGTDYSATAMAGSCGVDFGCHLARLPGMLFTGIAYLFLTLSGFLLGLAGTVFNWVVIRTVFQFGTYFGTNEGMLIAWGVMRDVANIGLLFGFILMGVLLILNVDGGGHGHGHGGGISAKKAIPRLIIFAVLLNFSLFASQVVIDVANAFSASFATLAGEQCKTDTTDGTSADTNKQSGADCANEGVAGKILYVAGLNKINDIDELSVDFIANSVSQPVPYAVSLIMLSLFVLITAMVLLAGAIMLIIRVVILSLLMVTSPIGFAGMAIPKLQGVASMWWGKLMSQAFFAPVYLLFIFISIKLTEGLTSGGATLASAVIGNQGNSAAGNMQIVMVFLIVIGFMIGSLIAASKMGATGAKFATQSAAALTLGAVGTAGRRTIGIASGKAATRIASSNLARTSPTLARFAYTAANKGASSSFSARTGVNKALGAMGAGLDIGNADKSVAHGIHGQEEAAVKARTEFADKLTMTTKDRADVAASEQTVEQTRIRMRHEEREQEAAQEGFKAEEQAQKAANETVLEPMREELRRKGQAIRTARLAGDTAEVTRLETELNNDLRLQEMEQKAAQERLEEIRSRASQSKSDHEKSKKELKEYMDAHNENIKFTKGQPQRQYAKAIEHSGMGGVFISKHANHDAAEKILKKLNRSENDKLVDAIKENKGGGGGGHAPAPAAPASGGGGGGHH